MTTYISINGHTIRSNAITGKDDPPIRIARTKSDQRPQYAREIAIDGPSRLVYSPGKPVIRCGARLALATEAPVRIVR